LRNYGFDVWNTAPWACHSVGRNITKLQRKS
jgi:hypothetical protein